LNKKENQEPSRKKISLYYINTSEIPSELSRENFISSHMKITCYPHMWRDHHRYAYIINRAFESKLIWYFSGVYIIKRYFLSWWFLVFFFIQQLFMYSFCLWSDRIRQDIYDHRAYGNVDHLYYLPFRLACEASYSKIIFFVQAHTKIWTLFFINIGHKIVIV